MEWVLIIEAILEIIAECRQDQDRAAVLQRLRRPGLAEVRIVRNVIRQHTGLRGRALRPKIDEAMGILHDMDDAELAEIVEDAEGRMMERSNA